jgi:tripartite-type tricarboxylate transporter receptor subunit TctC
LFTHLTAAAVLLLASSSLALAANDKPLTIVVPTAAGGGNDAMARTIGQKLALVLNQTVIIDNKAGANGAIAAELVARAAPDGNTLMFGYVATHAMNPALQKLRYDPITSFEPVGRVGYSPTLMVMNPSVKAKDVKELVALMKATPEKFSIASAGNGTAPHFAAELFKLATQTNPLHVPYKGAAPGITDTIGGQTQVMFPSLFTALPYVKADKLKALAIAGAKRSPLLPNVPTLAESGVNDAVATSWQGVVAPKGLPPEVKAQIHAALMEALADPVVKQKFVDVGFELVANTPEQFVAYQASESARWKKLIDARKISAD